MKKVLLILLGIVLVLALAFVALFFYSRAHIMDKGMEYGATYNLLQGKWVELYPSSPENAVRFSIKGDVLTYTAYEGKNKVEKTAKFTLDSTSAISICFSMHYTIISIRAWKRTTDLPV